MWIMFALFVLYAISLMFPFLWCLMNSFKGMQEFFYNVNGLPENWYFDNWKNSLTLSIDNNITIPQMYLNSVILTVGCTFFSMFSCSATAYVLTKFDFYGKSAIYTAAIVIMMIPTMGSMAAMYRLYNTIGLINTYTGIFITAMGGFGSGFLLLYGFYRNLSWTYAEAAQIDGAGTFRCFIHVVLPVCQPILGAAVALSFADCWNLVEQPLTYLTTHTELYPLSVVFNQLTQQSTGVEFAGAALYTLPALLIYLYFQNDILEGVQLTELK